MAAVHDVAAPMTGRENGVEGEGFDEREDVPNTPEDAWQQVHQRTDNERPLFYQPYLYSPMFASGGMMGIPNMYSSMYVPAVGASDMRGGMVVLTAVPTPPPPTPAVSSSGMVADFSHPLLRKHDPSQ